MGDRVKTNGVFHNSPIKKNLTDFKYDTVYFGTPHKLSSLTMKLDDVLFVSPLKGIASIFAVRPQNISKYCSLIDKNGDRSFNRNYKEWNKNSTDYLNEVHVYIVGSNVTVKPTVEDVTGYVYELKLTPELKEHIWWGNKMGPQDFEVVLKDLDSVTFNDMKEVNVKMYISDGKNDTVQESYQTDNTTGTAEVDDFDDKDPDDCYCESYTPLSEFDDFFEEGYTKKQEHRVEKFLKENKFKEDPSKTTDEEKRKGYRRGTIETDILDENGKKKRIDFELNPHPNQNKFRRTTKGEDPTIILSKKTAARKPSISNHSFKHEEGHAAIFFDKDKQKYGVELKAIEKEIMGFCKEYDTKLYHIFNRHDMKPEEIFADRYAMKHSKYGGDKIIGVAGATIETVGFINEIMSEYSAMHRKLKNQIIKNDGHIDILYKEANIRKDISSIEKKINKAKDKLYKLTVKIDANESTIKHIKECINRDSEYTIELRKAIPNLAKCAQGWMRFIKAAENDINDSYIIKHINGTEATGDTPKHVLDKMVKDADKIVGKWADIIEKYNKEFPDPQKDINGYVHAGPDDRNYEYDQAAKHLRYADNEYLKSSIDRMMDNKSHYNNTIRLINETWKRIDAINKRIDASMNEKEKLVQATVQLKIDVLKLSKKLDMMEKQLESLEHSLEKESSKDAKQNHQETFKALNHIMNSWDKSIISSLARALMTMAPEKRAEIIKLDKASTPSGGGTFSEKNVKGGGYFQIAKEEAYEPLSEFDDFFQEAKMKAKTRNELDDSDFALVYKDASGNKIRKYPINDEAHVKAAARMFPRGVPNKYRKEVAGKILRRAHKLGIDAEGWKSLNNAVDKD